MFKITGSFPITGGVLIGSVIGGANGSVTGGVEEFAGVKSGPESSKFKWYFPFETDSIEREVLVLPSDQAPSLSVPV